MMSSVTWLRAASSLSTVPEGSEDIVAYVVVVLASSVTSDASATAVGMMRCRRDFRFLSFITVISLFDFGTTVTLKKNKGGLDQFFYIYNWNLNIAVRTNLIAAINLGSGAAIFITGTGAVYSAAIPCDWRWELKKVVPERKHPDWDLIL